MATKSTKTTARKEPAKPAVKASAVKASPVKKPAVKATAKPTPSSSKSVPKAVKPVPQKQAKPEATKVQPKAKPAQPAKKAEPVAKTAQAKPAAAVAAAHQAAPAKAPVRAIAAAAPQPQKVAPAAAAKPAAPAQPQAAAPAAAAAAAAAANKKPVSARHGFKTNEAIVYPAHGVGRIVAIEEQEIAGMALELFVIQFEKDKLTLRVPTGKALSGAIRKLADEAVVRRALETLKGKARIKRTMWSRRAQEFDQKINSGDLISIAEVVRDLYRAESQPEQSYSERQLYEAALDRMAREIAAVEKLDDRGAVQRITDILIKSAKGRRVEPIDTAPVDGSDDESQAA